jgi:Flp pilus assembly protein TadG
MIHTSTSWTYRRFWRCQCGASAVEFAIVAPVFLMLIFGIITYGAYLAVMHGVEQLAAEAARTSVGGLSDTERKNLAVGYVTANAGSYPLIAANHLTVSAAPSADKNVFVVTVNYDASGLFIYSLPSFVPTPPSNIVRSAAIPHGGY